MDGIFGFLHSFYNPFIRFSRECSTTPSFHLLFFRYNYRNKRCFKWLKFISSGFAAGAMIMTYPKVWCIWIWWYRSSDRHGRELELILAAGPSYCMRISPRNWFNELFCLTFILFVLLMFVIFLTTPSWYACVELKNLLNQLVCNAFASIKWYENSYLKFNQSKFHFFYSGSVELLIRVDNESLDENIVFGCIT